MLATLAVGILNAATARVDATSKNANDQNSSAQKKILRTTLIQSNKSLDAFAQSLNL